MTERKNLKEILRTNPEAESIAVLIGPEGGFFSVRG